MTDQEIITYLQSEPERGMEQLVEQYTGLLWSVAGRLLREPEDIKECVNDTFAEFFLHQERFDAERGSLKGYLATITHRLAIRKYQENLRHGREKAAAPEADLFADFEQREELESYLQALDPVDEQIVRMKYYGGMTAKEIAASMGLPYETVKKRHQRSLKKLLKAMTMGLVIVLAAAVLVACAYVALRYFGIVPGYGVNKDPESGVYVMETGPVIVDTEEFRLDIHSAWWMNGILTVDCDTTVKIEPVLPGSTSSQTALEIEGLGDASEMVMFSVSEEYAGDTRMLWRGELPEGTEDTLTLTLRWQSGAECVLPLERVDNELSFEQAGFYDKEKGESGLLAVPRLENGELIVALYPLDEGEYVIHPMLTDGPYASFDEEKGEVTATAADGTVLTGKMTRGSQFSNSTYFEWNFGPAQPGAYTLHVPFVYQNPAQGTGGEAVVREVSLGDETGDPDVVFPVRDGEVRLTQVVPNEDFVYAIEADTEEVRAMNRQYAQFGWWDIDTAYVSADPERTVVGAAVMLTSHSEQVPVEVGGVVIGLPGALCISNVEPQDDGSRKLLGLRVGLFGGDADTVSLLLDPGAVGYRWNHAFQIDLEVK